MLRRMFLPPLGGLLMFVILKHTGRYPGLAVDDIHTPVGHLERYRIPVLFRNHGPLSYKFARVYGVMALANNNNVILHV